MTIHPVIVSITNGTMNAAFASTGRSMRTAPLPRAEGTICDHGPCMACDAAATARSTSRAQPCGIRAHASPR